MMQQKQSVTTETMKELLKKNWINQGFTSKLHEQQTYQQADVMLASLAKETLQKPPDTLALELPFNFWLDLPAGRQTALKVGGRIDRIDTLPDGKIEIIDYKTGKNVPTEKKVREDLQLSFYALAATEIQDGVLGKTPEEIKLTLYYLEEDKKISTTRTKEDLEKAKADILSLVKEIQTINFTCIHSIL